MNNRDGRMDARLRRAIESNTDYSGFCAELEGVIHWDHPAWKTRLGSLYEIARDKAWNAARDLTWDQSTEPDALPTAEIHNPLAGFRDYEQLASGERRKLSWWRHALEISEILHGEQGALLVASQLVIAMPDNESKLCASSQVHDEARHVEFFSRYLRDVAGRIHPPSEPLRRLIEETVAEPRWDIKLITCQVLIESLAMAKFQAIRESTQVAILRHAIDYVIRDEARHVRFGTELLREYHGQLGDGEREARGDFVLGHAFRLSDALNIHLRIADALGWDRDALRLHLRRYRIRHPEAQRSIFRHLAHSLANVGLLTPHVEKRLRTAM